MSGFDTFVMVDWSGGNDRGATPKKDAIWACVARAGRADEPVYLRNRQVAEAWLEALFDAEIAAGRRVMAGFDFPFGFPAGFAQELTGTSDPFAVWDWFEARIEDSPKANNRFDLAGEINEIFGGQGPFWANALSREITGLPRTKKNYENPFPDRRAAEALAKGAFTCWQLAGAGAVGSQVLMGLPILERLRRRFDVAVWPFQKRDAPISFVEIWPSLTLGLGPSGQIKDAWQVSEVARNISMLDPDTLMTLLDVDAPEEGWIFGLGFEDTLRKAGAEPPRLSNDCFALPPGHHWTPVTEALELLRARLKPITAAEAAPISVAIGRITATDVHAARSNPPLPNTAVDGYGFGGARGEGVHNLPLSLERAAAGDTPGTIAAGQAIRILTGAALPNGVDTVVLQEDVTLGQGSVTFRGPIKQGANTRCAGEDICAGDVVVGQNTRVGPAEVALMAATGVSEVSVFKPITVAVISTGTELVEAGSNAAENQIYDANRPMLLELIRKFGHTPLDMGCVPDDRKTLRKRMDQASHKADVVVTSGGASAGDEDHVSALLTEAGALTLWRIAVKPGRPLALGVWKETPVFGLPGNPVAAMVCALIFARPALAQLAGESWPEPQGFKVPAAFAKRKKPGRREYLRARVRGGKVETFVSEGSGRISGLVWAEGLVELPEDATEIEFGDDVRYIPFASFGI